MALLCCCYGHLLFSGVAPSVIRAVVMCMLMTVARAAGERTLSLNTLAIAAFFMLLYNPFIF